MIIGPNLWGPYFPITFYEQKLCRSSTDSNYRNWALIKFTFKLHWVNKDLKPKTAFIPHYHAHNFMAKYKDICFQANHLRRKYKFIKWSTNYKFIEGWTQFSKMWTGYFYSCSVFNFQSFWASDYVISKFQKTVITGNGVQIKVSKSRLQKVV